MKQKLFLLAAVVMILSSCAGPKYAKRPKFKRKHRSRGCGCSIQDLKQDQETLVVKIRA